MSVSCLDENAVVDLLRGRATGQRLADAENHLAACDDCAQLLADTAGTLVVGAATVPANDAGDSTAMITHDSDAGELAGVDVARGILAPGTALNDTYRVIRLIGYGGMGEVYEVAHARLSGRYAAKVLTTQIATTPEILSRFRREAQITSALHHPNIVQVVDFNWTSDGRPFLAMEYLEGVHLGRIIQAEGPLSLARVLQIVAPIVAALGAVHRRAIIHRDLKPQNIVLVPGSEEAGEVVKLLDFGLSKRTGSTGRNPGESLVVSQQRVLLGTPLYMAPEQALGDSDSISSAADQFSLSAIIYEMLTRRAAFAGDSVPTVLYRITHIEPAPMSQFVAGIPAEVEQVVRRALSKDPLARFPSIGAFFDAFREALRQATGAPSRDNGDSLPRPVVLGPDSGATSGAGATPLPAVRRRLGARAMAGGAGMALALALGLLLRPSQGRPVAPLPRAVSPVLTAPIPDLGAHPSPPAPASAEEPLRTNDAPAAPSIAPISPRRKIRVATHGSPALPPVPDRKQAPPPSGPQTPIAQDPPAIPAPVTSPTPESAGIPQVPKVEDPPSPVPAGKVKPFSRL